MLFTCIGGCIHTFGIRRAGAKLKTRAVYQRSDIVLSHGDSEEWKWGGRSVKFQKSGRHSNMLTGRSG